MSRFQHPPQTTGNEANISAWDRLNCARATFYAFAIPFNIVTIIAYFNGIFSH